MPLAGSAASAIMPGIDYHPPMGMDLIELVMEVEDAFGIQLPDKDCCEIRTVGELHALVAPKLNINAHGPCLFMVTFHLLRKGRKRDRSKYLKSFIGPVPFSCPSERPRPAQLPAVIYDPGATLRTVGRHGDVSWQGKRISVGEGLAGQQVRMEEGEAILSVYFAWRQVRTIPLDTLARARSRQVV